MPKQDQDQGDASIPARALAFFEGLILNAPKTWREAVWRLFSVVSVASMLASGFMLWRYPEIVRDNIPVRGGTLATRLVKGSAVTRSTMSLVSTFVRFYKPEKLAIVGWPNQMTTEVVWSNESTLGWPIPLGGVMSSELLPVIGYLHFEECWVGAFDGDEGLWAICPIASKTDPEGFIVAAWDDRTRAKEGARQLMFLARKVEHLVF